MISWSEETRNAGDFETSFCWWMAPVCVADNIQMMQRVEAALLVLILLFWYSLLLLFVVIIYYIIFLKDKKLYLLDFCTLTIEISSVCEDESTKKDACMHPGSFGDMCILCGQRLEEETGVTFGYIHKVFLSFRTIWWCGEFFFNKYKKYRWLIYLVLLWLLGVSFPNRGYTLTSDGILVKNLEKRLKGGTLCCVVVLLFLFFCVSFLSFLCESSCLRTFCNWLLLMKLILK